MKFLDESKFYFLQQIVESDQIHVTTLWVAPLAAIFSSLLTSVLSHYFFVRRNSKAEIENRINLAVSVRRKIEFALEQTHLLSKQFHEQLIENSEEGWVWKQVRSMILPSRVFDPFDDKEYHFLASIEAEFARKIDRCTRYFLLNIEYNNIFVQQRDDLIMQVFRHPETRVVSDLLFEVPAQLPEDLTIKANALDDLLDKLIANIDDCMKTLTQLHEKFHELCSQEFSDWER